jgi:hypothetical protein
MFFCPGFKGEVFVVDLLYIDYLCRELAGLNIKGIGWRYKSIPTD